MRNIIFFSLLLLAISLRPDEVIASKMLQYKSKGHVLGFSVRGILVAGSSHALKIDFVGAEKVNPKANQKDVSQTLSDKVIPSLDQVVYENLWNNITLVYDRNESGLVESTYHIKPHSQQEYPEERIRLRYNLPVSLDHSGNLVLAYPTGQMRESKPVAWQDINGQRQPVTVDFKIIDQYEVGFTLGKYDNRYALVIDPILSWNTFMGLTGDDRAQGITIDSSDNLYVVGYSYGTWGSPINAHTGYIDTFVAKLDSSGVLQWNTFMGSSSQDFTYGITIDSDGNLYVAGQSNATWGSPLKAHTGSYDTFVAKLDNSGVLQWNTFMGSFADDYASKITIDSNRNLYVVGYSNVTWGSPFNAHAGSVDTFVAKLDNSGVLQWNTFMGSTENDRPHGITMDNSGNLYVAGNSYATWGSPVNAHSGAEDVFVAKLSSSGVLQWNTFIGGTANDYNIGITIDSSDNLYVPGNSYTTWGTPINAHSGGTDAFVAKLNSSGVLQWNTFMGSVINDFTHGIIIDSNTLYLVGYSYATWGTPINAHSGDSDAFVAKLNSSGVLQENTFMGGTGTDFAHGITIDSSENLYVAGESNVTWGSPINAYFADLDAYVAKVSLVVDSDGDGVADSNDPCPFTMPIRVGATGYWNGGLQAVYDAPEVVAPNNIIKVQSFYDDGQLILDLEKDVTLQGGFDCDFLDNSGTPTNIGQVSITPPAGAVTFDNLSIE